MPRDVEANSELVEENERFGEVPLYAQRLGRLPTDEEIDKRGRIMVGGHCIKSWNNTKGPLALSSAEAEYYSMVGGVLKATNL